MDKRFFTLGDVSFTLTLVQGGLLKYGITQLDDVMDIRGRERAQNRFTDGIDEN